jgi:tetratricopeptide (TPR) repeat protein
MALGVVGPLLLGLGGCAVSDRGMVEVLIPPAPEADAALAAFAKGDVVTAESWATRALQQNPDNPYALLIRAKLADRAGQRGIAREAYERILALNPRATIDPAPLDTTSTPRPLVDIAAERLAVLPPDVVAPGMARVPGVSGPRFLENLANTVVGTALDRDQAWQTISSRFETLELLQADGLVTADEYQARRSVNLGALLPVTQPPPSSGLTRPAPRATAIATRLKDIATTYEGGAMSARQHAEERRAILDALLPADPRERMRDPLRPITRDAAAQISMRMEDALRRDLISPEEYEAERAAMMPVVAALPGAESQPDIEVLPAPAPVVLGLVAPPEDTAADGATPDTPTDAMASAETATASAAGGGPQPLLPSARQTGVTAGPATANADDPATMRFSGVTEAATDGAVAGAAAGKTHVHLASYRGMDTAREGWTALSTRYAGLLRGMSPVYDPVTLPGKGRFIRLKAGPVAIPGGPARLCDQLRAAGQFCEPIAVAN